MAKHIIYCLDTDEFTFTNDDALAKQRDSSNDFRVINVDTMTDLSFGELEEETD